MNNGPKTDTTAGVIFQAPHGVDSVTIYAGSRVAFGRSSECQIRFGYAPLPDRTVPRVAGHLFVSDRRIYIEANDEQGNRALVVRTGAIERQVPIGEGFSPREPKFDVIIHGTNAPWVLNVAGRFSYPSKADVPSSDPPTQRFKLELSEIQVRVLTEYYRPISRGRLEPATHSEVGAILNRHPNTVREILYSIWLRMFELDIPLPDIADKRVAVVEAIRVHAIPVENQQVDL
ncbi:hypothetical protein [Acidithrix ferrooxidans]|uniref:Uncharacterized protein n=1 Tax=Acidithrix ferrooxidans TaxID=1280514 RepID=A0A0D8HG09_9ACTN|nr:hypothetical protein [Acidithrix ferrooxidans]KJF16838.1 hypothetical protein AXFE_23390 [Acidithrix ferrooxidans]